MSKITIVHKPGPTPVSEFLNHFEMNTAALNTAKRRGLLTVVHGHVITNEAALHEYGTRPIRSAARTAVMDAIAAHALSRAEISIITGLGYQQVAQAVIRLTKCGLAVEISDGPIKKIQKK